MKKLICPKQLFTELNRLPRTWSLI